MSAGILRDSALQAYYDSLFSMYGTPGWQNLMDDYRVMEQTHQTLAGVDTIEQLWFRKGELAMIAQLRGHQALCEHAYDSLLAEQEGEDTPAPTGGNAKVIE